MVFEAVIRLQRTDPGTLAGDFKAVTELLKKRKRPGRRLLDRKAGVTLR
jgi:hypothetical protein